MVRAINTLEQAARLRLQAEELALRHSPPASPAPESTLPDWAIRMVHELRVHQIELEMQNEELRRAQVRLTDANARYSDLYHSAPIGLFILDESGVILDANLYAASHLGMSRAGLVRQPFTRYIPRKGQEDFYVHRRRLTDTASAENWELQMVRHDGVEFWAHLGAVGDLDSNGAPVLRITMSVLGRALGVASADLDAQREGSHLAFEAQEEAAERGATAVQDRVTHLQPRGAGAQGQPLRGSSPEAYRPRGSTSPGGLQPGPARSSGPSPRPTANSPGTLIDIPAPSTETGPAASIRKAELGDIPGVVAVHLASFQNFFLTFLGRTFLVHLYHAVAVEPRSVFLVATSPQNVVLGFAAGVPDLSAFYKRLARNNWLQFGLASVRAVLIRPSIIPRLWRSLRASEFANEAACPATLMSIAVDPAAKRMGLGKSLISRFLGEMGAGGAQAVCLTTDRDNNGPTITFYEQLGFRRVREFRTREGRWMCEFLIHPHEYPMAP